MTTQTSPQKLLNRNFFLQWQGQTVSRLGSQAFFIAMQFWIKHATGSATLMGTLQMVSNLPGVLLEPIGGVLADRYPRRRIIILSDLTRGIAVLALAVLIFTTPGSTRLILGALFFVALWLATVSAFFAPAIAATIPDLVPQDRVAGANSMVSLSAQATMFLGQGLGGVLFQVLGAPVLFLLNGLTFLYSSISEIFVTVPQNIPERRGHWREQFGIFKADIVEGFKYVWYQPGLRELVLVSAVLNFFAAPILVLMPFYVEDTLQLTAAWYGFLSAAYAVGAVLGYLVGGILRLPARTRGRVLLVLIVLNAAGYALLGLARTPFAAITIALAGGFAGGYVGLMISTIVQVVTPSEIRGRVLGLLAALSGGLAPIAMGVGGVVADLLNKNIPLIYVSCGVIMGAICLAISTNRPYRDILAYALGPAAPARTSEALAMDPGEQDSQA